MKTIFKHFLLVVILAFGFFSCEEDDNINFVLQPSSDTVEFTTNLSARYLISDATAANVADRLTWNPVDFGVPTVVTYTLEGSMDNTTFEEIASTTETNIAISVRTLLDFAEELGLDADPATVDDAGNPNNTGVAYFRVIAAAGDGSASNTSTTVSEAVGLNFEIIENEAEPLAPIAVSQLGIKIIGPDFANELDIKMYTRGDGIHFVAFNSPGSDRVFKLRENNDWTVNYGFGDDPESTIIQGGFANDIPFPEGDILVLEVDLNSLTYSLAPGDSWGIIGDNINGFNAAGGPDIRLTEDPGQPGLWFALAIELPETQAKFRLNNDWGSNWGPDGNGGLTQGSLDNFQIAQGDYDVVLDLRTMGAETATFGEPGSFGGDLVDGGDQNLDPIELSTLGIKIIGADFADVLDIPLYTRGDGIHFVAFNSPGSDRVFKLRENNDWAINYGFGDDPTGTLVQGGFENDIAFPEGDILFLEVDLDNLTFSLSTTDSWGIIGDNINGFNAAGGPDIRLTEDPAEPGLWVGLGIEIPMTQAKFRLNNDWANNWGPDGNGGLEQGSFDNFQLEAGTYNITLDLRDAGAEMASFDIQ